MVFTFYVLALARDILSKCSVEDFVEGLPSKDAKEVVATIAALRELGNKARRPLADYLEDGIYELRARRFKKQFRVLYTFAGKQTILLLTGFVKKTKSVPVRRIKKAKALREDYFKRVKGGNNG